MNLHDLSKLTNCTATGSMSIKLVL